MTTITSERLVAAPTPAAVALGPWPGADRFLAFRDEEIVDAEWVAIDSTEHSTVVALLPPRPPTASVDRYLTDGVQAAPVRSWLA